MLSEEDRKKVDIMRSSGVDLPKLLREYIRQLYARGQYTTEWNEYDEQE